MPDIPALPSEPAPAATAPLAELYRQLWAHAQGARGRLVAALAMLSSSQLLKLALPWLAAQAINAIQASGRNGLRTAGLWIAAMLGLHLCVWALHGPARVLERTVALRVRRSVADALYTRLAHAPLAWHEQRHSGDLQHRVGQAGAALFDFTQSQFLYLQNVINIAGPLLALWWLSQLTGLLAAAGFVLIVLGVLAFDRALMRLAQQENQAQRRYAARLLDFVGNMSAVASLRLQQATRRLLDARLLAVFVPLSRSIVLTEWKWCAVDLFTVALVWALVAVYAGVVTTTAAGGGLLIGSLVMVHQYAQQAAGVMGSMAANYQGLARMRADFASADVVRQAPQPAAAGPLPASGWQRIGLHGIGFSHQGRRAGDGSRSGIDAVALELHRGERLALVGPSGCGKSTLLRVLAGLYDAQQGQISIDGVLQPGRRHAAELATLIPQEADIFEATITENLTLGEPVAAAALQRAVYASALDEVLAGLPQGLDTPMSERGLNLSGGQRQRLALARGVLAARGSSLLLLDEPTSALDALIEQHVHQRLHTTFAGACIVAAVHRLSLLQHFDRVAFMVAGRLVDVGSVDELKARQPLFAAMCLGAVPVAQPADRRRAAPASNAAPPSASSKALAGSGTAVTNTTLPA